MKSLLLCCGVKKTTAGNRERGDRNPGVTNGKFVTQAMGGMTERHRDEFHET